MRRSTSSSSSSAFWAEDAGSKFGLPVGYKFRPTDQEIISLLDMKKVATATATAGEEHLPRDIAGLMVLDLYCGRRPPWVLFKDDGCWHEITSTVAKKDDKKNIEKTVWVFTKLKRMGEKKVARTAGGCGTWHGETSAQHIFDSGETLLGSKKMFSFEISDEFAALNPNIDEVAKGHWIMHEFTSTLVVPDATDETYDDYVVCKITLDESKSVRKAPAAPPKKTQRRINNTNTSKRLIHHHEEEVVLEVKGTTEKEKTKKRGGGGSPPSSVDHSDHDRDSQPPRGKKMRPSDQDHTGCSSLVLPVDDAGDHHHQIECHDHDETTYTDGIWDSDLDLVVEQFLLDDLGLNRTAEPYQAQISTTPPYLMYTNEEAASDPIPEQHYYASTTTDPDPDPACNNNNCSWPLDNHPAAKKKDEEVLDSHDVDEDLDYLSQLLGFGYWGAPNYDDHQNQDLDLMANADHELLTSQQHGTDQGILLASAQLM